jgi:hypothetical protein
MLFKSTAKNYRKNVMPKLLKTETERLALSLEDLDAVDPAIRFKVLRGRLDLAAGPLRAGEPVVGFSCPLLEAALACDCLRNMQRANGQKPCGVWLDKGNGWEKLPGAVILTVSVDNQYILNPAVFGVSLPAPALEPEALV